MKIKVALICIIPALSHAQPLAPPPLEKLDVVELPRRLPPDTIMVPFTISGGEVVTLPVTDHGPLPAQGGGYGVEFAGPLIGPLSKGSRVPVLTWSFSISSQIGNRCKEIAVEDVTGAKPINLATVINPVLDPGTVTLSSTANEISEAATPWLFERGATIKVFRFTFTAPDGKQTILYQPAWYSRDAKASLIGVINGIKNGQ